MKRITVAGGMESDDDSEIDDIVYSSSQPVVEKDRNEIFVSTVNFSNVSGSAEAKSNGGQNHTKLFVNHLPEGCTEGELQALFGNFGKVRECHVINKYGFVFMSSSEEAEGAIKALNNHILRGSSLRVEYSKGSRFPATPFSQSAGPKFPSNLRTRQRDTSYQRGKPRGFLNQRTESRTYDNSKQRHNLYKDRNSPRHCVDSESSEMLDDLRYAITTGNLEATKNMLSKGIWIDAILKSGWTGLMYACSSGHSNIVSYFLENKADPNYHKDMYTPLMAVCASRKNEEDLLKCCSLLLQYGANVNAHERHFTTPLMFAAREGYFNIVKELLDHGADPNLQDNRSKTALAWAASSGHGQIIRLLIEKGADPGICDCMGQSPEDLAYENGYSELVSLLQKGHLTKQTSNVAESESTIVRKTNGTLKTSSLLVKTKNFSKVGELELFLSGIGFSDLITTFQEHDLNFHDLLIMDESELEKAGINQVGVRKKILEACKAVHKKEWQNSSLPNLKQSQFISCPDAVAMMANIAKHLKFISSSVIYIRQQIQSQPRILELAQDSANVHDLIDEMEDSLKNIHFLNDEMRFLKLHLEKIQDRVQYIPADLIVETVPTNTSQRKILYVTITLATTAAIGIFAGMVWKNPSVLNSIPMSVRLRLPFLN